MLDLLTSLVDKSLVAYDEQGGEGRYWLLETIRQYARERLLEAGEAATVQERHCDWFLTLAEQSEQGLVGESQSAWLDRLEREHDNLRAALGWCLECGMRNEECGMGTERTRLGLLLLTSDIPHSAFRIPHLEMGLLLGGALKEFWGARGYWTEGRRHLAGLLALPGAEARTAARAKALCGAGVLARKHGDYGAAWALLEESLAIRRELGEKPGIAWSLGAMGDLAHAQGEYGPARALYEEMLAICRELGSNGGIAASLEGLASVDVAQAQPERAARLFGMAEALREALGLPGSEWWRRPRERIKEAVRAASLEQEFAAAWAEGRAMSLEQAPCVALGEGGILTSRRKGT